MTSLPLLAFLVAAKSPLWGHPAQRVGGLLGSLTSVLGMGSLRSATFTSSLMPARESGENSHALGRWPVRLPYTGTLRPFWPQILRTWSSRKGSSSSTTMTAFLDLMNSASLFSGSGLVKPSLKMETPETNSLT